MFSLRFELDSEILCRRGSVLKYYGVNLQSVMLSIILFNLVFSLCINIYLFSYFLA